MYRSDFYPILKAKFPDIQTFSEIEHTFEKVLEYFSSHERILISVSGGSDSDTIVHIICTYFPEFVDKCFFVWVNTGLEFQATKNHLNYLESRYNILIWRIRGKSVVWAVRKYGIPVLSKFKSTQISRWLHGSAYSEKIIFYDGVRSFSSMKFSPSQQRLALYIKHHNISVSAKCCDVSKKVPIYKFVKEHQIDLNVTGERLVEGGSRAIAHKSCFESGCHGDKFMPLWWWSNVTKLAFKRSESILYSDCYEVYGMYRTGCCGCPFSLSIADDLQVMFEHEPRLYAACMKVFGRSYELMDMFGCRRKKCLPEFLQYPLIPSAGGVSCE